MRTLNLNIEKEGIQIVEDIKKLDSDQAFLEMVIKTIEQAVISSYYDPNGKQQERITSDEQRKINILMREVESNKKGIAELKDSSFAFLITKWKSRLFLPLAGSQRKTVDRIDRIICADEFKQ